MVLNQVNDVGSSQWFLIALGRELLANCNLALDVT